MIGKKKCGNCGSWMKMKNDRHGGGLCHEKDARRSSDDKRCELWSGIKHQRANKNPTPNERE